MKGKALFFAVVRGFGMIVDDENQRYFVHHTDIRMPGFKSLVVGTEVEFDACEGDEGLVAKNVVPLGFEGLKTNDDVDPIRLEDGIVRLVFEKGVPEPFCHGIPWPNVVGPNFSAYSCIGKVEGFTFELPRFDGQTVYLVLEPEEKEPVVNEDGKYFVPMSTCVMSLSKDGHAVVYPLGRRHQKEKGKNLNWIVVEKRLEHRYDLSYPITEQGTPSIGGLKKDNTDFNFALEAARRNLNPVE